MKIQLNKFFAVIALLVLSLLLSGCGDQICDLYDISSIEENSDLDSSYNSENTDLTSENSLSGNSTNSNVERVPDTDETSVISIGEDLSGDDSGLSVIDEKGVYATAEDVALYIHTYGRLPSNFITKNEARKLGWEGGSLENYAPGKCIGGDRFGNYEGLLPEKSGRNYTECDIDTLGKSSRGAKRIVYSNDGLIYYTEDHYDSFILLYGEE